MGLILFTVVFGLVPGLSASLGAIRKRDCPGWVLAVSIAAALILAIYAVTSYAELHAPLCEPSVCDWHKHSAQFYVYASTHVLSTALLGLTISAFLPGKMTLWAVGVGGATVGLMVGAALFYFGVIK